MPDTRSYAERKARESETYGTDEATQRRTRAEESDQLWAEAMHRERIERLREKVRLFLEDEKRSAG